MPEIAIGPGDAGDVTARFDGAQDRARFRIEAVDFVVLVLADPEGSFGPCQSGTGAGAAGRGNGRQDFARSRVDLLDAAVGDLEQVAAVERRAGLGLDRDRARQGAACGVQRPQRVAGREPDMPAVEGQAVHLVDAVEGAVFADDARGGCFHDAALCEE